MRCKKTCGTSEKTSPFGDMDVDEKNVSSGNGSGVCRARWRMDFCWSAKRGEVLLDSHNRWWQVMQELQPVPERMCGKRFWKRVRSVFRWVLSTDWAWHSHSMRLLDNLRLTSNVRIWTPPLLQTIRLQAVRYDCSRISGLVPRHLCQVLDPDGLFAR